MNYFSAETAIRVVDLLLLAIAVGAVLFAGLRRSGTSSLFPITGLIPIVIGLLMFVAAYLVGVLVPEDPAPLASMRQPVMPATFDWLYWTLTRVAFLLILVGLLIGTRHRKKLERQIATSSSRVKYAEDAVTRSETRFRALFETTSNSIFCYTFDPPLPVTLPVEEQIRRSHEAILTECNAAFARSLRGKEPSDIIGSRMGMLDGNKDEDAHAAFFGAFVKNDYRVSDYELVYKSPQGEDYALRSSLTGIVSEGLLHRFWGVESDILDLKQTKAALRRRRQFEELVAKISSALVISATEEADNTLTGSIGNVCRYTGADRVTIFWLNPELREANVAYSWGVPGDELGPLVSLTKFPVFTKLCMEQQVLRIDDTAGLPDELRVERQELLRRNIKSLIAVPLVVGGEIVGALSIACRRSKRRWSDEDVKEIRVFADLFANYVYRLRSRRSLDVALDSLKRATDRLEAENVYLREEIETMNGFDEIIGQSPAIMHCLKLVKQVASTNTPVLLLGETGTGKELIARAIHEHSDRKKRPLVKVNCAALPAGLIESELFGYEKGAFTGAEKSKRGRFDLADGSTLFLDEIGDIPLDLQAKLLRAIQEGEIERLGGSKAVKVDVRLIVATNRDLSKAVHDGEFRSDLFYRINTFPIELPPLRDRGDDIQILAEHLVKQHSQNLGRDVSAISASMMERLRHHPWPGNVRELEGVIQRALISSTGPILELPTESPTGGADPDTDSPRILSTAIADLRVVERDHILSVLEESKWKIAGHAGAAAKLGMPPSTLRSKMQKLSISRPD